MIIRDWQHLVNLFCMSLVELMPGLQTNQFIFSKVKLLKNNLINELASVVLFKNTINERTKWNNICGYRNIIIKTFPIQSYPLNTIIELPSTSGYLYFCTIDHTEVVSLLSWQLVRKSHFSLDRTVVNNVLNDRYIIRYSI